MFLNEEQRLALFNSHIGLAYSIAQKYSLGVDVEDYEQESACALWIATGLYDDERSEQFSSYAYYVIKDYVRLYKQRNRSLIYFPRGRKVDMLPIDIADNDIPDPMRDIDEVLDHEYTIRDLPSHLTLVARLKLKGYTVFEIGDKLDLHETTVLDLLKQIRQNLQG